MSIERDRANACRWRRDERGHYESWFCRGNDPGAPLAFWIRYTIFSPRGRPHDAVGERWAVVFDRARDEIIAVKDVVRIGMCRFAAHGLDVEIGDASLRDDGLTGHARTGDHAIAWDLSVRSVEPPLLLYPASLYRAPLPKAKVLVSRPLARFAGTITVDDRHYAVDDWIGSVNHNWGERHTDHYAWGQVAGFDEDPDAFLECATARLQIGPFATPWLRPLVLRIDGRDLTFHDPGALVRARGEFEYFSWRIATGDRDTRVEARFVASAQDFVALRYDNPPGGTKTCLNSKLARCELHLHRKGEPARRLTSDRAAFEILTSDDAHGLARAL